MFDFDIQEYHRHILDKGFAGNLSFLQQHAPVRIDDWKRGVEQNHPAALFFLGLCYAHDIAVPANALESLRLVQLAANRLEEHTSELQSRFGLSYVVFL